MIHVFRIFKIWPARARLATPTHHTPCSTIQTSHLRLPSQNTPCKHLPLPLPSLALPRSRAVDGESGYCRMHTHTRLLVGTLIFRTGYYTIPTKPEKYGAKDLSRGWRLCRPQRTHRTSSSLWPIIRTAVRPGRTLATTQVVTGCQHNTQPSVTQKPRGEHTPSTPRQCHTTFHFPRFVKT